MKKILVLTIMICLSLLTASLALAATSAPAKPIRLGASLGFIKPLGDYDGAKFKIGPTFGLEGRMLVDRNLGVGGFLDYTTFSSEKKSFGAVDVKVDMKTTIIGALGTYEHPVDSKMTLYGTGKLGLAFTTAEAVATGAVNATATDTGRTWALILEGGGRYWLTETVDVGVAARYSYISQSVDRAGNVQLGGLSLVGLLGFHF